jgi:hypothetical protein
LVLLSAGALALGFASVMGLAVLGPVRETVMGSLLAFSSVVLLVIGTACGVLISMVRMLEATDATPVQDAPT